MNKSWRHFYIVLSVVLVIFVGNIALFVALLNKPLLSTDQLTSTFENKHSDKDIMDYVEEEHGFSVTVI